MIENLKELVIDVTVRTMEGFGVGHKVRGQGLNLGSLVRGNDGLRFGLTLRRVRGRNH